MKKVILIILSIIFGFIIMSGNYNDWAYIIHGDPRVIVSKIFTTIFSSICCGVVFWLGYELYEDTL